ncbi:hypothetical protein BC938DRAFT_473887, partial [Jimgerdemannia flammicorona]
PLHSTPFHSTPLHSTPLHSTPLHSTPLHSPLLHSNSLAPSLVQQTMRDSRSSFPLELVLFVLEHLAIDNSPRRPILSLLLINKLCYRYLFSRIYQNVRLSSWQQYRSFFSQDRHLITHNLRHLNVEGTISWSVKMLADAMANASNLTSLTLRAVLSRSLSNDFHKLLSSLPEPQNLKALTITAATSDYNPAFMQQEVLRKVATFQNLRLLHLGGSYRDSSDSNADALIRLSSTLAGQHPQQLRALLLTDNDTLNEHAIFRIVDNLAPMLKYLALSGTRITGPALECLADRLLKLDALAVGGCNEITTKDVECFIKDNLKCNITRTEKEPLEVYVDLVAVALGYYCLVHGTSSENCAKHEVGRTGSIWSILLRLRQKAGKREGFLSDVPFLLFSLFCTPINLCKFLQLYFFLYINATFSATYLHSSHRKHRIRFTAAELPTPVNGVIPLANLVRIGVLYVSVVYYVCFVVSLVCRCSRVVFLSTIRLCTGFLQQATAYNERYMIVHVPLCRLCDGDNYANW